MTDQQIEHVIEQLIRVIDRVAENENATAVEVEALAAVAQVLAELIVNVPHILS